MENGNKPIIHPTGAERCPICGDVSGALPPPCRDYLTGRPFGLRDCAACGTLVTVIPADFDEKAYYGASYYRSDAGKFLPGFEGLFARGHIERARRFFRRFRPESVLEIGCGRGYMLQEFKALGCRAAGLESPDAPSWILDNPRVEVRAFSESELPWTEARFDLVLIWHVLEHLEDPAAVLKTAHRLLRPGGRIVLSLPDISSLQARLGICRWFHLDVPRHRFHFSRKSIEKLVRRAGFNDLETEAGDGKQNLFGAMQSLANLFTPGSFNGLYRLLQGHAGKMSAGDLTGAVLQLLTACLWGPAGLALYLIEELRGRQGTVTVVARKE